MRVYMLQVFAAFMSLFEVPQPKELGCFAGLKSASSVAIYCAESVYVMLLFYASTNIWKKAYERNSSIVHCIANRLHLQETFETHVFYICRNSLHYFVFHGKKQSFYLCLLIYLKQLVAQYHRCLFVFYDFVVVFNTIYFHSNPLLGFTKRKRNYVDEKTTITLRRKQTSIRNHLRTFASLPNPSKFYITPLNEQEVRPVGKVRICCTKKKQ